MLARQINGSTGIQSLSGSQEGDLCLQICSHFMQGLENASRPLDWPSGLSPFSLPCQVCALPIQKHTVTTTGHIWALGAQALITLTLQASPQCRAASHRTHGQGFCHTLLPTLRQESWACPQAHMGRSQSDCEWHSGKATHLHHG